MTVARTIAGAVLALLLAACAREPRTLEQLFPKEPRPESLYYTADGYRVHYMQMAGPAGVRILFIHGTPGDWTGWAHYLADPELQKRATMIAVDRPGFGDSGAGHMVPAIRDQARLLEPLLRGPPSGSGPGATTIVVGHSLGGPIAAELAMDYPAEVRSAVLIAPSIDPSTEQPRWYNQAMTWWPVRRLAPDEFAWSNAEIMPLVPELESMAPRWKSLPMPVTVIQGDKDRLVDPRTADYAARMLPSGAAIVRVPDEGHFVLWEKPQIVVKAILAQLDAGLVAASHTGAGS